MSPALTPKKNSLFAVSSLRHRNKRIIVIRLGVTTESKVIWLDRDNVLPITAQGCTQSVTDLER